MSIDFEIEYALDGSTTLISPIYKTSYHSIKGAFLETDTVFIQAGLAHFLQIYSSKNISIFEMGFGTGLNIFMAYQWAKKHQVKLDVHTVDNFILDRETLKKLNFTSQLGDALFFETLHECPWNQTILLDPMMTITKHCASLHELSLDQQFDVIFYDAFAPSSQPELWTKEVMQQMFDILRSPGLLVTYCAQGQFKRNLKSAGFSVESIPGPPGKREMTRASKNN